MSHDLHEVLVIDRSLRCKMNVNTAGAQNEVFKIEKKLKVNSKAAIKVHIPFNFLNYFIKKSL